MRYNLDDQAQATSLMKHLWPKVKDALASGRKLTLEIKPASKSRDQEEKYHAIIGDIAKQAQHMGARCRQRIGSGYWCKSFVGKLVWKVVRSFQTLLVMALSNLGGKQENLPKNKPASL